MAITFDDGSLGFAQTNDQPFAFTSSNKVQQGTLNAGSLQTFGNFAFATSGLMLKVSSDSTVMPEHFA